MSDDKIKKRRFEGLIQFREALRQSIVCLQASMGECFVHSVQSALLRELDESQADAAFHHLLFGSQGQSVGLVDHLEQIGPHHILTRIYQQQGTDLKDELRWPGKSNANISAWLDPSDGQAAALLFRLLSMACRQPADIDIRDAISWGSVLQSKSLKKPKEALSFVKQCQLQYNFCHERSTAMENFVTQLLPLLRSCDSIHLLADGTSIGLMIEGKALNSLPKATQQYLDQLAPGGAHTLAINCSKAQVQFAMFTPIRMNHANLGVPSLKGVILLHDLKRSKAQKKLAS